MKNWIRKVVSVFFFAFLMLSFTSAAFAQTVMQESGTDPSLVESGASLGSEPSPSTEPSPSAEPSPGPSPSPSPSAQPSNPISTMTKEQLSMIQSFSGQSYYDDFYDAWLGWVMWFQRWPWDEHKKIGIQLIDYISGDEANAIIQNENFFNDDPGYFEQ